MKNSIVIFLVAVFAVILSGCGNQKSNQVQNGERILEQNQSGDASSGSGNSDQNQNGQKSGQPAEIEEIDNLLNSVSESDYDGSDLTDQAISDGVEQE